MWYIKSPFNARNVVAKIEKAGLHLSTLMAQPSPIVQPRALILNFPLPAYSTKTGKKPLCIGISGARRDHITKVGLHKKH